MKKQISIILMFTLLSFIGFSQVATKPAQDTTNAKLALIKNASYSNSVSLVSIKKSNDTLAQSLRVILNSVDSNSVYSSRNNSLISTNTTSLALVKKSNDTLAQSLRVIINSVDSNSVYLSRNSNVGGFTKKIINTITTNTVTYSSGDNIGGIGTITNAARTTAGTGTLLDIQIWSTESQTFACTVDIWSASPSGTYTNNGAEAITGDQATWLGSISVSGSDFITTGTIARAHIKNVNLDFGGQAAKNLFFTIVTTSTPAWTASTTGFYLVTGFKQD